MKCPFKRGDMLKCVNTNMSEYGQEAFVDSIGDETARGWEVTFFGGSGRRNGIVDGSRYDTADFTKTGSHPRIGKGWW